MRVVGQATMGPAAGENGSPSGDCTGRIAETLELKAQAVDQYSGGY